VFSPREAHALYLLEHHRWQRLDPQVTWHQWYRAWWQKRGRQAAATAASRERRQARAAAQASRLEGRVREQQQHLERYQRWCQRGGGRMSPVGGSRHYVGGGLGNESGWKCPSCGAENGGPIAGGCQLCGAGKPGVRAEPPPAPPEPPDDDPPVMGGHADHATAWAAHHPYSSVADAYRAGYLDGLQAARGAQERVMPPELKIARTLIAALEYFADQVLRQAPQEVQSGEWCSVEEVQTLIQQLAQQAREATHV
jgi:hypothetical protein